MFEGPVDSDDEGSDIDEDVAHKDMRGRTRKPVKKIVNLELDTDQMMRNMGLGGKVPATPTHTPTVAPQVAGPRPPPQPKTKEQSPAPPTRKSTIAGLWKKMSKADLKVDTSVSEQVPPLPHTGLPVCVFDLSIYVLLTYLSRLET